MIGQLRSVIFEWWDHAGRSRRRDDGDDDDLLCFQHRRAALVVPYLNSPRGKAVFSQESVGIPPGVRLYFFLRNLQEFPPGGLPPPRE